MCFSVQALTCWAKLKTEQRHSFPWLVVGSTLVSLKVCDFYTVLSSCWIPCTAARETYDKCVHRLTDAVVRDPDGQVSLGMHDMQQVYTWEASGEMQKAKCDHRLFLFMGDLDELGNRRGKDWYYLHEWYIRYEATASKSQAISDLLLHWWTADIISVAVVKPQGRTYLCCGLTLVRSSAPHSCSLTPPQWDGGENPKGESEITHGLR